ncbi:hypothetical protein MKW98_011021, partial [Papaver atlanticum]
MAGIVLGIHHSFSGNLSSWSEASRYHYKMALEITERNAVLQGIPLVQVSDKHLWFSRPQLILYRILFTLFQDEGVRDSGKFAAFDFDGLLANTDVR